MLTFLRDLVSIAYDRVRERVERAEVALAVTTANIRTAKRRR